MGFRKHAAADRPATEWFTIVEGLEYRIDGEGGIWTKKGGRIGHVSSWHAESVMAGQQMHEGSTVYQEMIVTVTCGEYVKVQTVRYGYVGGTGSAKRGLAAVAESNAKAAAWAAQHP